MTKTLTPLIILVLMLLLPAGSTFGQGMCGDVNGDATLSISDIVYLFCWIIMDGPDPVDTVDANTDLCNGVDVGDVAYLIEYIFWGGPPPCGGGANCSPNSGGSIVLDSVSGEIASGVITTGDSITFYLRFTNSTDTTIRDISNGFRIYSPDGAQWGTTGADTTGTLNLTQFDMGIWTNTYSADGSQADTVGIFGASIAPGMPKDYDDVALTITIGPISSAYVGKTICLDSCFYGPGGSWKWQVDGFSHYAPDWGGPYCFTIQEPILVVTPDTLNFSVYQGSLYPVAGSFHVSEASGANIPFQCDYLDSGSFISLSSFTGTTPDDIIVWAHVHPWMSPGTYQHFVSVDAEAGNTPLFVIVNMTVYAEPEAALILDDVTGHYGTTGIKTGVPVTLTMRAINNSGATILGADNGHRVYSPDGAQWDTLSGSVSSTYRDLFDLDFFVSEFSIDGSGADTIGFVGIAVYEGMPDGYDDLAYSITIGPIDSIYDGQIICLDSSYYPPVGPRWLWSATGDPIYPEWSGPHCFMVHYVPFTLVVTPDTLHFEAVQGGPNPSAQSLFVEEAGSADIVYYITDSLDGPVFYADKHGGHTPDSVVVTVDIAGLPPGTYVQPVIFDAIEANNTPVTVYLELTVTELQIGADSLIIPSVAVDQVCGAVQPVAVQLSQPIKGATIPIKIPPDAMVLDLSFEGLLTESWDYNFTEINPDNGFAFVALANSQGLTIPVGTTTVFSMTFNTGTAECLVGSYTRWDTTLMDNPGRALLFADTNNFDILPGFDYLRDSTLIPGYLPGDFDGNQACNVVDVTGLVDYLFFYGPPPCVLNAMDANGTCTGPNIADLTYIIDYLFWSGPEPVCGCLGKGSPLPKVNPDILVTSLFEDDVTTVQLSSPIELRGVQLELKGAGGTTVANLLGEKLDLVYGQRDGVLRVGLLDLNGAEIIAAGEHQIVSISGEYKLVSAIVSDMDHNDIVIATANKPSGLPNTYALYQNYPNPFNPVTTISFSVKEPTDYTLTIYNLYGQMVGSFKGTADRGVKVIEWDASHHATGVYLYKLEAGSYTETRKMMLLK
jgi:hypothetical protein